MERFICAGGLYIGGDGSERKLPGTSSVNYENVVFNNLTIIISFAKD